MNDNKPEYILVHCSAYPAAATDRLQTINKLHLDRGFDLSSLGYYVGYHFLLTGGKQYRTRADLEHGDHCNNVNFVGKPGQLFPDGNSLNFHSLSICVDFDGDQGPMPAWAVPLLKAQVQSWMKQYSIPLEKVRFHRDFSGAKTCPGSTITREWLTSLVALPAPAPTPTPAPPAPVVVDPPEVLKQKITLLQTLIALLQELLFIKQKQGLGSSLGMNDELNLPAWYQSSAGPGVSATLIHIAGNVLPVINFVLQSKGIEILPADVNFWLTLGVFVYFSIAAAVGYVRAKLTMQRQVAALRGQVSAMGASPVL